MSHQAHNRLKFSPAMPVAIALAVISLPWLAISRAAGQTATWTGGGANNNWTTADNWSPAGPPANGDTLEFSGFTRPTSTNDISGGAFAGLLFSNDGTAGKTGQFTLSGNAITLDGNVDTTTAAAGTLSDTVGMALALTGNRTFTTGGGHNLAVTGVISGDGFAPIKAGLGGLTFSAANTFTGPLTVNSGTLVAQSNAAALGAGTLVLNDGSAVLMRNDSNLNFGRDTTITGSVTMTADRITAASTNTTFTLGSASIGDATITVNRGSGITGNNNGTVVLGATTLTGPVTVANGVRGWLQFGAISETGGPRQFTIGNNHEGWVVFGGTGSWTGGTVVNAGTLRATSANALGAAGTTTTVNGATLDLRNGSAAANRPIVFNGSSSLLLANNNNTIFNTGSMTLPSSGTMTIASQVNSGSATMTHTLTTPLALNGSGALVLEVINGGGGLTTLNLTGGITDSGVNLVRKVGTGVLLLNSDMRNRGETRLSNGFVRLGRNEALASGAGFGTLNFNPTNSALLQLNGFNQTINGIANSGTGRSIISNDSDTDGRITLGANNAGGTFSGEIRDISLFSGTSFNGKLSLVKTGTGELTLSGLLLYTGTTHVEGGTLRLLTSQTSSAGPVTVASGATLSGTGVLRGTTTIAGGLAPGATAGTVGTLSFGNGLTWEGAATAGTATDWSFTLGSTAGSSDLANITGDFLKGTTAGSTFNFDFGGTGTELGTYTLATWTGVTGFDAADFSYSNLAADNTASFVIDGNSLTLQVVPEPGTAALLLGAGGLALLLHRRRSRRR